MDSLTAEVGSLRKRMEQLERQNRWMKWTVLACLLLAISTSTAAYLNARTGKSINIMGKSSPGVVFDEVRAKRYLLVDEKDKQRGIFGFSEKGEPGLGLKDQQGKTRSAFVMVDGEPSLDIYDRQGKGRGQFCSNKDGELGLAVYDQQGRTRAVFGVNDLGEPSMGLLDQQGKIRGAFGLNDIGAPALSLYDHNGKAKGFFGIHDGEIALCLYAQPGKGRVGFSFDSINGEPLIDLSNRQGKTVWSAP